MLFRSTIHNAQGTRLNNSTVVSVSPIKDVKVHYQYSASEVAGTKSTQAYGADATFGAVSASVGRFDNGLDGANKNASTIVGGKLAIGATGTTLFGIYSEDEALGVKTEGKTVGVTQKISGPLTVLASYGEKQGVDGYALGATYAMSKRTFLHARYRNEDSTTAANDRKQVGVGIEHNF